MKKSSTKILKSFFSIAGTFLLLISFSTKSSAQCSPGFAESLTKVVSGNADALGITSGPTNPNNILGQPDGNFAYITGTAYISVDLTDIIPTGTTLTFKMARWDGSVAGNVLIYVSDDNATYNNVGSIYVDNTALADFEFTIPATYNPRYIAFAVDAANSSMYPFIDAVSYAYTENECLVDTDNDGIADELDLDDDGDGIPDATELGVTCLQAVVLTGGTGGKIYQVNLETETTTLFTTSGILPAPGSINCLAANADAQVLYYGYNDSILVYNPATNTHSLIADIGAFITGGQLESGGASYFNGYLYVGAEDEATNNMTDIYQIPLSADGLTFTGNPVALGITGITGGFGDFIVKSESTDGVIYGSTTNQRFWRYDIGTTALNVINNRSTIFQMAVDFTGQLWGASGNSLQRIDGAGNPFGAAITLPENSVDMTGPFNCAQPNYNSNTDGDAFSNHLDIDADNDGIVDNTEVQSTVGYVPPSGVDTDNDGIDDAYDSDCTPCGAITGVTLVPVNTDGLDNPDYLDLDTDNDGIADTIEGHDTNGDGVVNGSDSPAANTGLAGGTTDIDGDGLLDGFDNNTASTDATNTNLNAESHPDVQGSTLEQDWREVANTTLAENDINQTPINTTVAGNILTNDTDFENDTQVVQSATYLDNLGAAQNLTLASATDIYDAANVLAGAITLNVDGTYTFVPVTDYTGTVPVEYVAVDDNSVPATDAATLEIQVLSSPNLASNNPPVAQDDTNTTEQGVTVTSNILANDRDVDGDVLSVTTATGLDIAGAAFTLTTTPTNIYDATNALAGQASIDGSGNVIFTADASFTGEVPVEYAITDSNGGTDDATLTITVEAVNLDNDTYANDDANTGLQGEVLSNNILFNDVDPESNTQTVTSATSNSGTTINLGIATPLTGIGSLLLFDNGNYAFTPEANFIGTEPVAYQICDNGSPVACEMATLYLTVLPYENSTQATNDYTNTPYDAQVTSTVLTNDRDLENNVQTVNSMMVDSDGNGTPDLSKPLATATTVAGVNENGTPNTNAGTLTQAADGKYTFIPTAGFVGVVTYSYVVCDDGAIQECETATVEIDVLPESNTSNSSVAASPDAFDTELNTTINSNIIINDNDPEGGTYTVTDATIDTNGDGNLNATLTIGVGTTVAGIDEDGNAVANAGTLTLNAVGTMMFVPATGFTGTVNAEYEITDTDGDTDTAPLVIEVVPNIGNQIFATDDSALTDAETPVSGDLVTNDNDPEFNLFAVTGLKVDSDGDGIADLDKSADLGGVTSITVGGVDKDGVAYTNAGTLVIDYDGTYTFTPAAGFSGNVNVDYTICDAVAPSACDVATLEISVLEIFRDYGDAPAIYPAAWHRAMADGDANNILDGTNDVWLGSSTTFEASGSVDADVNDDAITYGTTTGDFPTAITPSATYDVDIAVNSTSANTVHYGMWIDWDNNGTYEDFYSGSQATAGGAIATDATVTITAPASYTGETVNTRLRVDDAPLLVADFQGGKTNGEVEDFARAIALPVKLSSFKAKENGCAVDLIWKTESEDKFEYFEIEWSGDGKDFKAVDQIISIGNNGGGTYHYSDSKSSAHNYYRLKMVDLDGAFEYSPVAYTRVNCTELEDEVIAYPNPLGGGQYLTVQFSAKNDTEQIMITDRLGRVIRRMTLDTQVGKNSVQLDLSDLSAGAYHLQIVGSRVAKTIVIQN